MTLPIPGLACALVAALSVPAIAEWRVSTTAIASSTLAQRQQLFVGGYDASTGAGDVRALDSPAAANHRWSAAMQLRRHPSPSGPTRTIVIPDVEPGSAAWTRLMEHHAALPLGAVRNANVWLVAGRAGTSARPAMVYAGAHDGMLHGFAADDGSELLAYVPRRRLDPSRTATFAVDGPVFSAEAPIGPQGEQRSLLVAGLGAGGAGFIALDVSTPDRFASMRATDLVLADTTASVDPDLGQLHAPPVLDDADANRSRHIVRMASGRWALVIGNGYFSAAGRPALLVQYLDQARELFRLSPCLAGAPCAYAGNNGLAMPRLLDTDGDGRIDLAYAGDLHGHVWRFKLRGAESDWRADRLFTACDAQGRRQPITTAPYVQPHPAGGQMLVLGTGRQLKHEDSAVLHTQSLYGLHDRGLADPLQAEQAACSRPATLKALRYTEVADVHGMDLHTVGGITQEHSAPGADRGWWIDLPRAGQRVLHNPQGFEGYKVLVRSVAPSGDATEPRTAGRAWLSVLNLLTGLPPAHPAFTIDDAAPDAPAPAMVGTPSGPALLFRRPGEAWLRFANGHELPLRTGVTSGARAGWREQP